MLGLAGYESDEDKPQPDGEEKTEEKAEPTSAAEAAIAAAPWRQPGEEASGAPQAATGEAPATAPDAANEAATDSRPAKPRVALAKLREVRKEVDDAKSATAVVQVVRKSLDSFWDARWGAEALYQIAKRSTARTRKAWASDPAVQKLSKKLQEEATASTVPARGEQLDLLLVSLEALRRMALQEPENQRDALERAVAGLVADHFRHPVKTLARLFWLTAPVTLKGASEDFAPKLATDLRCRSPELQGPDVALLIQGLRSQGNRDGVLVQKVSARLRSEGIHAGLAATDLVEMAEGLKELGVMDEGALRPLGQEILRRRGELTPDESHRAHGTFAAMKLPLPQVWTPPGSAKKREGAQIVTVQAFAPQEGHEKKRRGNHDIEKTSPPRVVRDYKMMSY